MNVHSSLVLDQIERSLEQIARTHSNAPPSATNDLAISTLDAALAYLKSINGSLPLHATPQLDNALLCIDARNYPRFIYLIHQAIDDCRRATPPGPSSSHQRDTTRPLKDTTDKLMNDIRRKRVPTS
jgi:hypothetical protein